MDNFFAVIGGLGIGSLITVVVQSFLQSTRVKSERAFNEKKEAYVGLLEALRNVSVEHSNESVKDFAYWQMRCELVGSKKVRIAIQKIIESNNDKNARAIAMENLKRSLREDMSV